MTENILMKKPFKSWKDSFQNEQTTLCVRLQIWAGHGRAADEM